MQKALEERALKEEGKIHRGMKVFEYMNVRVADYKEIHTANEESDWTVKTFDMKQRKMVRENWMHIMVNLRPKYWLSHHAMIPPLYDSSVDGEAV